MSFRPAASQKQSPTSRQTPPIASQAAQARPPAAANTFVGRRKMPVPMMPLMPSPTRSSRDMRRADTQLLLTAEQARKEALLAAGRLLVVVLEHLLQLAALEEDPVAGLAATRLHLLEG